MESLYRVLNYVAARLREPSTYPGLFLVGTGLLHWSAASSASKEQIVLDIGMAIAGLISVALPDRLGQNTRATDVPPVAQTSKPVEEKKP